MAPNAEELADVLRDLERVDRRLRRQVERARLLHRDPDELRGLHISEQQVNEVLARESGMPEWSAAEDADRESPRRASARLRGLARLFGLEELDVDVLLTCLAPEVDPRYQLLFAYLQDDVTRKHASVDLLLNVWCASFEEKLRARERFAPDAPLLRHRLVALVDPPGAPPGPRIHRQVQLDERIADHLLGSDRPDARLARLATAIAPATSFDDVFLRATTRERFRGWVAEREAGRAPGVLYLQGPRGTDKARVAEALCRELGVGLLTVDASELRALPDAAARFEAVALVAREARLRESALFVSGFDALLAEDQASLRRAVLDAVSDLSAPGLLAGEKAFEPPARPKGAGFARVELAPPDYAQRKRLWSAALPDRADSDAAALANAFRLSAGEIRDALASARRAAEWRDPGGEGPRMADLAEACRRISSRDLSGLAQRIHPRYTLDDIVLPADRLEQLAEICNHGRRRGTVYEEWGFDRKLALGKGLNVLFAGPSGTGKTMAAEVVAGSLELDLFKIDLSATVSKYIGETEKNLSRVFAEAARTSAILFFDEADALFGKRTEVRDAHDRYANIETGYLLQKMEEYEGPVILATNLRKNMDDAFLRRMHFTVEFPFPGASHRERIWRGVWPEETPLADLDFDFLADRLELAGGNIRNVALAAAFLAAGDGGVVRMPHVMHAARREYQKMGKVVEATTFRPWSLEPER